MAEIIANEGGGHKKGKRRPKKLSTHIDMTPMVDLACLLLTFFMLTTAFAKPKMMEIVLPEKDQKKEEKEKIPKFRVVNILIDENDKVYYYNGMLERPPYPELIETNFSKDGIRKLILQRNKRLFAQIDSINNDALKSKKTFSQDTIKRRIKALKKADKIGPIVLIKATDKAKYKNMVDVIDEMAICNVAIYSLIDINPQEMKMLEEKKSGAVSNLVNK
jgi:biopolymer transport protein ExbD